VLQELSALIERLVRSFNSSLLPLLPARRAQHACTRDPQNFVTGWKASTRPRTTARQTARQTASQRQCGREESEQRWSPSSPPLKRLRHGRSCSRSDARLRGRRKRVCTMNPPMGPAAPPPTFAPAMPMHPHPSRRQQDYHNFHHAPPPPQPPMHHPMSYAGYHNPYYPHPAQHAYQAPRWQAPYHQPPYMPPPPQHIPYSSHSPVVVTSQPPLAHPLTPVQRHTPMPLTHQQPAAPSPGPIPQHMPNVPAPAPVSPSPAPVPPLQPEQEHMTTSEPDQRTETPPAAPSRRHSQAQSSPLSLPPEFKTPFYPKLPWYSIPEGETAFPHRDMARKRRRQNLRKTTEGVALPSREDNVESTHEREQAVAAADDILSENSTIAAPSEPETPATSQAPSESEFSHVSTPATPAQATMESPIKATPTQPQTHVRRDTRTAIAVPIIASLPKPKASPPVADKPHALPQKEVVVALTQEAAQTEENTQTEDPAGSKTPPPKQTPKSWADLVRANATPAPATNGAILTNGAALPKNASLSEALRQYRVNSDTKLSFLEPRGLVNTGNMCYMNSVCFEHSFRPMINPRINARGRFFKYLYSAPPSTAFWTRCGSGRCIP